MSQISSDNTTKNSHFIQNLLFKSFLFIMKFFPLPVGVFFGKALGLLAYFLLSGRRKLTIENIKHAKKNGFLSQFTNVNQLARNTWKHLGMVGGEFLYYYSRDLNKVLKKITIEGEENLKKALSKQKGVIFASGHIGNWELFGIYLVLKGYILNPIVKTQENPVFDVVIEAKRRSIGMKTILKNSFLRPILQALHRNELVSFLSDQAKKNGIPIKFFGRTACFPQGAAQFALKTGAPVIFAYIFRKNNFKHHIIISEEIEPSSTGDFETDLAITTTRLAAKIEAAVEEHPEQWLWMHKMWK